MNAVAFSRVVPLVDMEVPDYPVPPPPASARGAITKPSPSTPRSSMLSASSTRPASSRSSARRSIATSGVGGRGGTGSWVRGAVFASGGSDAQILLWRANFDRCTPAAGLKGEILSGAALESAAPGATRQEKAETFKNADEKNAEGTESHAPDAPPPHEKLSSQTSPLKSLENDSFSRAFLSRCFLQLYSVCLYSI